MAEQHGHQSTQQHAQQAQHHATEGIKNLLLLPSKGPSVSQLLAVATLFPVGGLLLALSGLTLAGTVVGLAVTTPLFVLFSPILVPAAIVLGLAVTGFLTSGAFGLTAVTSLSWIVDYMKRATERVPEQLEHAKRRVGDAAQFAGQRTKEAGQQLQNRPGILSGNERSGHEGVRT